MGQSAQNNQTRIEFIFIIIHINASICLKHKVDLITIANDYENTSIIISADTTVEDTNTCLSRSSQGPVTLLFHNHCLIHKHIQVLLKFVTTNKTNKIYDGFSQ